MENPTTLERIVSEISKVANIDNLGPDTKIGEINLDSLKFIELLLAFTALYPGETQLDQLVMDSETSLRQLDAQLRGELVMGTASSAPRAAAVA